MSFAFKQGLRFYPFSSDAVITPQGGIRNAPAYPLVGGVFTGSSLDTNNWTSTLAGSGAVSLGSGEVQLRTNTTANSTAMVRSNSLGRLISGTTNYSAIVMRLGDTGVANNQKKWGAYSATAGYFFLLDGAVFKVASRKTSTDTVISSFNGGNTPVVDTNYHIYEIYSIGQFAWLFQDGKLIHKFSPANATLVDDPSANITFENNNISSGAIDTSMWVTNAEMFRLGIPQLRSNFTRISTATSTLLKTGPGTLSKVIINTKGTTTANMTIYDNTSATGTIIGTLDCVNAVSNVIPYEVEFNNGLFIVTTATAGDYTVIYH